MINKTTTFITLLCCITLIAGCASAPKFDTTGVEADLSPQHVANAEEGYEEKVVIWGGVIINSSNLKEETQLEILAYPLRNQQPDTSQNPLGRFLALHKGYLETKDYTNGRAITIKGKLQKNRIGQVGEMKYTYPTLTITQIHLWSSPYQENEPRFHFGIGVRIHN